MSNIVNSVYKNEEITTVFDLKNIKEFSIENLINNIEKEFRTITEKNNITPSVFVPNNFELTELEAGFIDVFYNIENVNYLDESIKEDDKKYLTNDAEVGKCLFFIEKEENLLSITFKSLIVRTENNEFVSIFEFSEGMIFNMLKDVLTDFDIVFI